MFLNNIFNNNFINRIDEYAMPPKISFGYGASEKTGEIASSLSLNKKAIIITDDSLVRLGMVKGIEKSLSDSGFTVKVFAQQSIEPTLEQAVAVCKAVRDDGSGIIIGFGGGSSLDRAKIASCFASMPDRIAEYTAPSSKSIPADNIIPKILIPTTSGTGSEASNTAVVIVPNSDVGITKTWVTGNTVLADAVIVDPVYMKNLPPRITAASGFDALSHCAEGIISKQANSFSDALSLEAVKIVSRNLRTAYHRGNEDPESRWNLAMAAMIGGMVISYGWVSGPATLGHAASEGISPMLSVTHGDACAVLLPYVYWFNLPDDYAKKKLAMIAEAMGVDTAGLTLREAAEAAIFETFNLMEDLDMPLSLKEYGLKKEDIPKVSEYILNRSEEMYNMSEFNPRKATLENLIDFFEVAYAGREEVENRLFR